MQLLGGVLQKNHPEKFRQVDEKVYVQEFLVAVTVTKKTGVSCCCYSYKKETRRSRLYRIFMKSRYST